MTRQFGPDLRLLVTKKPRGADPFKILCPFHPDQDESGAVYPDHFYCYGCGKWLGYYDTKDLLGGSFDGDVKPFYEEPEPPEVDVSLLPQMAKQFHDWLWYFKKEGYLLGPERGLSTDTIRTFQLGYDGFAYTIPISSFGNIVTIRKRKDGDGVPKYWGIKGLNTPFLFTPSPLAHTVVWCEGEFDTLIACQYGYCGVTMTNGVGTLPSPEILDQLWWSGVQRVVIALDQDQASFGRRYVLDDHIRKHEPSIATRFARFPTKDLTELHLTGGKSAVRRALGEPICQWQES